MLCSKLEHDHIPRAFNATDYDLLALMQETDGGVS